MTVCAHLPSVTCDNCARHFPPRPDQPNVTTTNTTKILDPEHERRIRSMSLGLIKSLNNNPYGTDEEILHTYGEAARPLAETFIALLDEIAQRAVGEAVDRFVERERLDRFRPKGLFNQPGITFHTSPNIPPNTAYVVDSEVMEDIKRRFLEQQKTSGDRITGIDVHLRPEVPPADLSMVPPMPITEPYPTRQYPPSAFEPKED